MKPKSLFSARIAALSCLALAATPAAAQANPWARQVETLVRANFTYPRSAQVRGDEGRAVVLVQLATDGKVTGVTLSQSSGSQILDREAVRIPQKIGQFPKPPSGTKSISLPITWRLN